MPKLAPGPQPVADVVGVLVRAALVVAFTVALLIAPGVQVPGISILAQAVQNVLHVPLFMLVSHVGWMLARRLPLPTGYRLAVWLLTLLALAAGTEWLQHWTGRSASFTDVLRNLVGIAAWAGLFVLVCARGAWRAAGALLAGLALLPGCADLANTSLRYVQRNAAAPLVFAADRGFSRFFTRVTANVAWTPGYLDVRPAGRHWTVIIDEPLPDWRAWDTLCVDWAGNGTLDVSLRIHDWEHNQHYRDRFNLHRAAWQGRGVEAIALTAVEGAPRGRRLQMDAVAGIVLFGDGASDGWLHLHTLWLAAAGCDHRPR